MNKKELIDMAKRERDRWDFDWGTDLYSKGRYLSMEVALEGMEKLDEPKLPVIPQFVADFIKEINHDKGWPLGEIADILYNNESNISWSNLKDYEKWARLNFTTFARAWLDGYKIEKEKQYFVKEPITRQFLIKDNRQSNGVKWTDGFEKEPSYYTEQEIKAIDERYWSFAEEVPNV